MAGSRALKSLFEWLRRRALDDRHRVTVTIAPAQAERIFQLELPRWTLRLLAGLLATSLVLVIAGGILYGFLIRDALALREVRKENAILRERAARLGEIEQEIARLDVIRRKLYALAGVPEAETETGPPAPAPAEAGRGGSAESPAAGADSFPLRVLPLDGPVSRPFSSGEAAGGEHRGIDIAGSRGSPVRAAGDGVVVFAGWDPVLGNLVVLDHGGGLRTRYGHNETILVETGDRVPAGFEIARVGSTGMSSAPHLHFEVLFEGEPIDPRTSVVPFMDGDGSTRP